MEKKSREVEFYHNRAVSQRVREFCDEFGDITFEVLFLRGITNVEEYYKFVRQEFEETGWTLNGGKSFYPHSYLELEDRRYTQHEIKCARSLDIDLITKFIISRRHIKELVDFMYNYRMYEVKSQYMSDLEILNIEDEY